MKYNPHDYQRYAAEFITTHPIAALLLDMGLGKTSITLTAINDLLFDSFEVHKVLVVAPLRVARKVGAFEKSALQRSGWLRAGAAECASRSR